MKKMFALLLAFMLLGSALAETYQEPKLMAEIKGTRLLTKWENETSDQYEWLAVDLSITNWHTDTQSISNLLSGHLAFREAYIFDAVPVFPEEAIGPLVEMNGTLIFKIPKMVAHALNEEEIKISILIDGVEQTVALDMEPETLQMDGTLEGPGYDTPEEAFLAYLDALNSGNVSAMLSTFALESCVEHMEPEMTLRRTGSYQSSGYLFDPYYSDYAKGIVLASRYGALAEYLRYQYIELSLHTNGRPISGFTKDSSIFHDIIHSFADSPVNQWKNRVEFVEWLNPAVMMDMFLSSQNIINISREGAIYGVEDYCILAARIRLNGTEVVQTMGCGRYGGRWYNIVFINNLSILMNCSEYYAGMIGIDPEYEGSISELLSGQVDPEQAELIENWQASGLIGTHWKLVSLDGVRYQVTDSAENIRDASGEIVWADLRMMHHGGATVKVLFTPTLDSVIPDGEYGSNLTFFAWSKEDSGLSILTYGGMRNPIDLEGVRCKINDESIVFQWPNGIKAVFQRLWD